MIGSMKTSVQRIITLCVAIASAVLIYFLFHRSVEALIVAIMVAGSGVWHFFKGSNDDDGPDPNRSYERRE